MINPDLLRTFIVLAETRHFSRTAERLHMTQPGVSQHLKRLEEYFAAELVQREGKSFHLTDAGRSVVEYGRRLFQEHARLREHIAGDDPYSGLCRYASPGSFGFGLFDVLLRCAQKHPGLRVEFTVAPNPSVAALLLDEKIDVGFVTQPPPPEQLEATAYDEERLLLAVPKAVKGAVSMEKLRALGFVNHPDGFHHATRLLSLNFSDRFTGMEAIPIRVFVNQISRILEPVALGLGFTVLPEYACRTFAGRSALRLLPLSKEVRDPIYRVTRRGAELPSRFSTIERTLAARLRPRKPHDTDQNQPPREKH